MSDAQLAVTPEKRKYAEPGNIAAAVFSAVYDLGCKFSPVLFYRFPEPTTETGFHKPAPEIKFLYAFSQKLIFGIAGKIGGGLVSVLNYTGFIRNNDLVG